jgi:hypothetical protein
MHGLRLGVILLAFLSTSAFAATNSLPPIFQFWNWFPDREANGYLELYDDVDTTTEDCLIFILDNTGIHTRQESPSGGVKFVPVSEVQANLIIPTDETLPVCEAQQHPNLPNLFELRVGGAVLYTLVGNYVLWGEVDVPSVAGGWPALIAAQLLFEIEDDQVFLGYADAKEPQVLVTATAEIEEANPFRKLAIAAAVDGACGSPGLPPEEPMP